MPLKSASSNPLDWNSLKCCVSVCVHTERGEGGGGREREMTFSRIIHTHAHTFCKININNIPVYGIFLYFQKKNQGSKAKE